jgi:adenylate cyclase
MGLPVNMAARLQEATKEINNSFLISEYAYSMVMDQSTNPESENIILKGVSRIIKVFLLGKQYA